MNSKILFKTLLSFGLIFSIHLAHGQKLDDFFTKADSFFNTYVSNGKVNYTAISSDRTSLDALFKMAGSIQVSKDDAKAYQAFWINAYNITVIKSIVDAYPIYSPMDVPGFFDQKKHYLGGKEITLNFLENELLRAEFKEPRYHFVLVCGAISCPIIENFAYTPDQLEAQLHVQATKALNDINFLRVNSGNKSVLFSQIFKWYQEDFSDNEEGLIDYVNQYRAKKIPADYEIGYYDYNWTLNNQNPTRINIVTKEVSERPSQFKPPGIPKPGLNLQTFTPGTLLRKGQMDFTSFNTIYTQTHGNWQGSDFEGTRETFATALLQWTYGVSKNARVNVGLDVYVKGTARTPGIPDQSGIGEAFTFKNDSNHRFGIGAIGARVKFSPLKNVNNFAIQSTFLVSPFNNAEGLAPNVGGLDQRYWIEWDRYIWWNQFFWDKTFGADDQFQVFAEADLLFRFKRRDYQSSHLDIPLNLFLSYFPTPKFTVYVMTQHVPRYVFDTALPELNDWVIGAEFTASGVGAKYQLSSQLNLEVLYTNFWRGTNTGLGETYNLGIKYLTR